MIRVTVDTHTSIMGVEMLEQLILPVEKTMNERQFLSLIMKDK